MAMRTVSFTDRLELEFEGNVMKNAICFGDVDNDGFNELVIGNDKGDLAVFKGESTKPYYTGKILGIIAAIAIGDVLNVGRNVLMVITACGHCSLFELDREPFDDIILKRSLIPFHNQNIPANIKVVYVGDINGDGVNEVIVGLTDRVVRTFRWVTACESMNGKPVGKLVGLNKWEFAEQIGTITLHKSNDGGPCILVAQPSGTFITLKVESSEHGEPNEPLDESMGEFLTKISMNLEPLATAKLRNSEICGNIINKSSADSSVPSLAIATLDGILMLVKKGKILWKRSVDHELFSVNCVDLTGDGNHEIVACAWDGHTFIVKHNNEGIQFAFQEPVNAFTAGMFGLKRKQTTCLVYVTFNNKIFLYYDVVIPYMNPKTLIETLTEKEEYLDLVDYVGIDTNDVNKIKELNKTLLYRVQ